MNARIPAEDKSNSKRLLQYSFLMLFVELVLIRFSSANFMFLAFFANYILMASFLGIAIGFMREQKRIPLFELSPFLLAALLYLCYRYQFEYQVNINPQTDDLDYNVKLFSGNLLPLQLTLPAIFLAVVWVMAALSSGTASVFRRLPPLAAYRQEILGSLLGVLTFTALALLHAGPWLWALIICSLFIALQHETWRRNPLLFLAQIPALVLICVVLGQESTTPGRLWSPYYKIAVLPYSHGRYAIDVNGAPQQFVETVSQRRVYKPFYFLPYTHLAPAHTLDNVLVIGAGTGGDVAIALAAGAKHVDAVEIDPVLLTLGKQLNPDAPYADARVTTHINDGRAFLRQNTQRYDLIIFALTDSMTVLSHHSSLRLENYLLTLEGLSAARSHLQPDGAFAIYNYYRTPWVIDRLAFMLSTVYGQSPCLDTDGSRNYWLSVFTISNNPAALHCEQRWQAGTAALPPPATDDHPFFYLNTGDVSSLYPACLFFIFLTSVVAIRFSGGSFRAIRDYPDLFLMGAAFLLLETKNVINFALLFGSTWLVNALVFIGILATVYAAILVTEARKSLPPRLLFLLLMTSLIAGLLLPNALLLGLPVLLRLSAACVIAFAPVFFANLIFAERFRVTAHSTQAFAANICGAIAGGLLEYSSILIGYQNLLIVAGVLYAAACFSRK